MRTVYGFSKGLELLKRRPIIDESGGPAALDTVRRIISNVRSRGDEAVLEYTHDLDGAQLEKLEVSREELEAAEREALGPVKNAIQIAAERIRRYHQRQKRDSWVDFSEGGMGMLIRPLDRAGLYAPGGKAAYPSTVLMTGIPAKVAGVPEVVLATPPQRDGCIPPVILYAAGVAGIDRVFKMGGAQAIAAMAYGTESVPKVDKICGPGNIFVTLAKKEVFGEVGIDGLEGPSEAIIIADGSASPSLCAADLLAQAEHDELASAFLVTTSQDLGQKVREKVDQRLAALSRSEIIAVSLNRGGIIVVDTEEEEAELVNAYAPEHLSIMVKDPWSLLPRIRHAGAIFLGGFSSAALGDYIIGPNHILPTGGTARFSSPLRVDDFTKSSSLVALNVESASAISPSGAVIAEAEGLTAHASAIKARLGPNDGDTA